MSLEKMIALHPDGAGNFNEPLALAARHAGLCSLFCTSCADACVAEAMDMTQCIRLCLDCADVCGAAARIATRRAGGDVPIIRQTLELCIAACEACAAECERHDHGHCKLCATMCRECGEDCRKALGSL